MSFEKLPTIKSLLIRICFGISFCVLNAFAQTNNWPQQSADGIKFQIALNRVVKFTGGGGRREMFLFVAPETFTPENLQKIFLSVSSKYPKPVWLDIDLYDNKYMLQRAIKLNTAEIIIHFKDTPEGREASEKWWNRFGPPLDRFSYSSYLRIERENYSKSYIEEAFFYTPKPDSTRMTEVQLRRNPGPPYSGNVNSDLIIAVTEGDVEKVQSLLSMGADVNSMRKDGDSALMIAALSNESAVIVKTLIKAGANVNFKNKSKDKYSKNQTALIYAAQRKDLEIFNALIDAGVDLNAQNGHGYTALIMAAAHGNAEMVKLLLSKNADTKLRTSSGETALDIARTREVAEIIAKYEEGKPR